MYKVITVTYNRTKRNTIAAASAMSAAMTHSVITTVTITATATTHSTHSITNNGYTTISNQIFIAALVKRMLHVLRLHGIYNINCALLLPLSVGDSGVSTRGHSLKQQKRDCKSVLRADVLGYRIVNLWYSLPEDVVSDPTVNSLKFDDVTVITVTEDFKF